MESCSRQDLQAGCCFLVVYIFMCLCAFPCPLGPFLLTDDYYSVLWNTGDILKAETDSSCIPYQRDCVTRHQDACVPHVEACWNGVNHSVPLTMSSPWSSVVTVLSPAPCVSKAMCQFSLYIFFFFVGFFPHPPIKI